MSTRVLRADDGAVWTLVGSAPSRGGFRGIDEEYPEMDSVTVDCTSDRGQKVTINLPRNWEALPHDDLLRRIEGALEQQEDDEEQEG